MAVPWLERPTLTLDGSLDWPRRLAGLSDAVLEDARNLLRAVSPEIPPAAVPLAQVYRLRTLDRFHAEVTAMADRIGGNWQTIFLANLSYDLLLSTLGCSTIALPTPDGPVLARNMDWWPEDALARSSYVVRTELHGKLAWSNAGWPGAIGVVTGLCGHGFALALNAVLSPEPADPLGYPALLHLRRVLEDARSFDEALELLQDQRLVVGAAITLVGTENPQRVVIERTPTRAALRWAEPDRVLITTNDYRLLHQPRTDESQEIYRTTCHRYDSLCGFFPPGPVRAYRDEELLYLLTDERVLQGITAQHIILRPRRQTVRLFVPRRFIEGEE